MTVGEFRELIQSYPGDHQLVTFSWYDDIDGDYAKVYPINSDDVTLRTIFVNRRLYMDFKDEDDAEPAHTVEAVVIREADHDEARLAGMHVEQAVEHLKTYSPSHKVIIDSRNISTLYDYHIRNRTLFETKREKPGELPQLRFGKSATTTRDFHAVIIEPGEVNTDSHGDSHWDDGGITVEELIGLLLRQPMTSQMFLGRDYNRRPLRLNLNCFREQTVFGHERYYFSDKASEETVKSVQALCVADYTY